jgi:hypothetical protein
MSKLHKAAIPRLAKEADGEGMTHIFEAMIDEAEELGNEVGQVSMPFIEEGDEFTEGEWVPELWFVVRKVLE